MQIVNKKKFIVRILEITIILTIIILTPILIVYANKIRGYEAIGGEYLIPILSLIVIQVIEDIYQESEKRNQSLNKK